MTFLRTQHKTIAHDFVFLEDGLSVVALTVWHLPKLYVFVRAADAVRGADSLTLARGQIDGVPVPDMRPVQIQEGGWRSV